ncbi:MAG TPA: di-heme oxidoredictase family protein [Candidatus Binatia bacterium]|jgi:mono/diheme cytochrome c family protein|nr:di-heme oxidoredictase family protein [Candidatus Binatia bacterium]
MRARPRRWLIVVMLAALAAVLAVLRAQAGDGTPPDPRLRDQFAVDASTLPDDALLLKQLAAAVELRHRENFDRMLDAKEPGELIEHATLTEVDFDHRTLGIDTLFIVGDELFGYLFRPENGWGSKDSARTSPDQSPQLRRVHQGVSGGPEAFACFSCHAKGGPDGAGTQSQIALMRGDGARTTSADRRNAPHLLGLGPVALLANEMSTALRAQVDDARRRAQADGRPVEQALTAKGVSFGHVVAKSDGTLDVGGVDGVDADLTVRPFGWKGHQATLRGMTEESLHIHQGLLSKRVQLGVRDGTVDAGPYGTGRWDDVDRDGVSLEIDDGMLTTVVGYLAQLEAPVIRPPRDPGLLDAFAAGRAQFDAIGCAGCHVPTLELDDPRLDAQQRAGAELPPFVIDVAKDGDGPKIEPKYAGARTSYLVRLFSDLKRHDMGPALASPSPQGTIPANVFLTRPLWGLAETAPYLHDGRAPTIHDAIVLHGGEATPAREAYLALDEPGRASVRVFLASLSRQPKLFVP